MNATADRIGQWLVRIGALNDYQLQAILEQQKKCGRPFGELAERMFGVRPEQVERAWIEQYLQYGTTVDLETRQIDVEVLRVLNRRQAWQFRMLPVERKDGQLHVATCREKLPRAVNFAWRRLSDPVYFLIARRPQLEQFLQKHYPWPAMQNLPDWCPQNLAG